MCSRGHDMRCLFRCLVYSALAVLSALPAHAEKRVALTVGIDAYDKLPALEQLSAAANDARAMGTALRQLGFAVTVEENLARLDFLNAWQSFLNKLGPGDTAALFFAGHGVEIGGLNYLLPRDVPKVALGQDKLLAGGSIRFNELMDDLRERKVRVALLIIDACRDNPFRDGTGRSVGSARGLARVEPPEGTFVMYSAGAGEQALDRLSGADLNPNSVYTRTLLPILAMPGLSLQDIAARVREEVVAVARTTGRKQTPAYYDQLVGKFVFKPGVAVSPATAPVAPPASPSHAEQLAQFCGLVAVNQSLAVVMSLAETYRGTPMASCIEAKINELRKQEISIVTPQPVDPPKRLTRVKVAIKSVVGPPKEGSQHVYEALVTALRGERISIAFGADEDVNFRLVPYILAQRRDGATEVCYVLEVKDTADRRLSRFPGCEPAAGSFGDPWAAVTPAMSKSIATKSARSFAMWLQ
jgi:caspase domain-containing protein